MGEERAQRKTECGLCGIGIHPVGMYENSPTFQRWVRGLNGWQVPKGRLKARESSAVPSGLGPIQRRNPNAEALGYFRISLREKEEVPPVFRGAGLVPPLGEK